MSIEYLHRYPLLCDGLSSVGKDVVLVDSDPASRHKLASVLKTAGFHVYAVACGSEALEVLQTRTIRVLVCNWCQPSVDTLEFCGALRTGLVNHYVYVIMLTSVTRPSDAAIVLRAGADEFLGVPSIPLELIQRIKIGFRLVEQESRAITIYALARIAESRDRETGGHVRRVSFYCRLIAQHLLQTRQFPGTVNAHFVRLLTETSPLHDIGKVAIPDQILRKPGALTAAEFAIMKTHTLHGAAALAETIAEFPQAKFLQMAHTIALYHHERFDGSGYPFGLSGDDIPLAARIVALADAYDAITSQRSYKPAYTPERARSLIVSDSGSHFDPRIVEAFLTVEEEFLNICRSHPRGGESASDPTPAFAAPVIATCDAGGGLGVAAG